MSTADPAVSEVAVSAESVIVKLHHPPVEEKKFDHETFAGKDAVPSALAEPAFYAAFDAAGHLAATVTITEGDRKVVAALVGNWIAQGLAVQQLNRKDLIKRLRTAVPAPVATTETTQTNPEGTATVATVASTSETGSETGSSES